MEVKWGMGKLRITVMSGGERVILQGVKKNILPPLQCPSIPIQKRFYILKLLSD